MFNTINVNYCPHNYLLTQRWVPLTPLYQMKILHVISFWTKAVINPTARKYFSTSENGDKKFK